MFAAWQDDNREQFWAEALCNDGAGSLVALFFSEQLDDIARAKASAASARCGWSASTARWPAASPSGSGAASSSSTARCWRTSDPEAGRGSTRSPTRRSPHERGPAREGPGRAGGPRPADPRQAQARRSSGSPGRR